jgi:hypothetical protein
VTDLIPYTHWAYWSDRNAAERCRAELADLGFRVAPVERSEGDEDDPTRDDPRFTWLLRAAKEVGIDDLVERHDYVEAIVQRFGGFYDGGESTFQLDDETAEWIRGEQRPADLDDLLSVLGLSDPIPVWDVEAPEQLGINLDDPPEA